MEVISVIVPVYRAEKYIKKCIDSLCGQSYSNLELIFVDDGSPDQCGHILDEAAERDERIKVIHKENGGAASARNAGLATMSGDYVAFADADDAVNERYIETLYHALKGANADVAICGFHTVDEEGKRVSIDTLHDTKDMEYERWIKNLKVSAKDGTEEEILKKDISQVGMPIRTYELYSGNDIILKAIQGYWEYVAPWGKLFRADLYKNVRYPDWAAYEDESVFIQVFDRVEKAVEIPDRLYDYVQHDGSLMNSAYKVSQTEARLAMWEERLAIYHDGQEKHENLRNQMEQAYMAWAILYLAQYGDQIPKEYLSVIRADMKKYKESLNKAPHLHDEQDSKNMRIKYLMLQVCPWLLRRRYQ